MTIRILGASLFILALFSGSGCNNTNCEDGAYCVDGEKSAKRPGRECLMFCGRLAACGAPQAEDFDACVADCDARFESTPDETAMLCACAEWSSCDDLSRGRCSEPPHGSGGASGSSGAAGSSGANAGSGAAGNGGSAGAAGSGGAGAAGSGAAGTGGTGAAGTGGTGAAGSAGSAGSGGSGPIACGRDCDCPLPDVCVGGYCVAP